jgi:hypothetical protein
MLEPRHASYPAAWNVTDQRGAWTLGTSGALLLARRRKCPNRPMISGHIRGKWVRTRLVIGRAGRFLLPQRPPATCILSPVVRVGVALVTAWRVTGPRFLFQGGEGLRQTPATPSTRGPGKGSTVRS